MPRIKRANRRLGGINPQVRSGGSGQSPEMIEANAFKQLGGQIAGFGLEVFKKRKQAEDQNFVFERSVEDSVAIAEESKRLRLKVNEEAQVAPQPGAEGPTIGYAELMNNFIKERFEKNKSDAPSGEARDAYSRRALPFMQQTNIDSQDFERNAKALHWKKNLSIRSDEVAKSHQISPDPRRAINDIANISSAIVEGTGIHHTKAQESDIIRGKASAIVTGVFDGLEAQGRWSEGLALLDGRGEGKILMQAMDSNQTRVLRRRFERSHSQKQNINLSTIRSQAADVEAFLNSGLGGVREAEEMKAKIARSRFDDATKKSLSNRLDTAISVGDFKKQIKTTSVKDFASLIPSGLKKGALTSEDGRKKLRARRIIESEIEQNIKLREDDGAQYVLENYQNLQALEAGARTGDPAAIAAYTAQSRATQQELGINNIRLTTKAHAAALSEQIMNEKIPPAAAARILDGIQSSWGNDAPQVLSEMILDKNNGVPQEMLAALYIPSTRTKEQMIENIRNSKDITANFKAEHPGEFNLVKVSVSEELDDFRDVIAKSPSSASRLEMVNGMQRQMELEIQKRMASKDISDLDDVTEEVSAEFVQSNFTIAEPRSKQQIIIPKSREFKSEFIEGFVKSHSDAKSYQDMGVIIPPSFKDVPQEFYDLLEDNGRWVTNSNMDGLELVLKDPVSDKEISVRFNDNKIVKESYKNISVNPDDKTLEASKTFFQGIFGG